MAPRTDWWSLSMDAALLGLEAQGVITLRMLKAAVGGAAARKEAYLMVTEKAKAAADIQRLIARSLISGQAALAPGRTVALCRRRVRANRRRLATGG